MRHIPRKRFGQHFLKDPRMIERFIAALAPKLTDHLVEIGPGQGALTLPLLKKVHHLDAIELDRDLIGILTDRSEAMGKLNIYSADALTFDFGELASDNVMLRIFGSLPYNISTPLFFHLLKYRDIITDMLFILQKEVALRLAAKANDEHYGRLSVMAQYHCDIALLFDIPARSFYPAPQVTSTVIRLAPYRQCPYLAKDYLLFENIVRSAFQHRRKTLRNSLKLMVDDSTWSHIKVHSDLRPENLSVKDFVEMSNAISVRR